MTPAGLLDTTPRRAAQRRTVRTLAASQVFSGLGNGSALAVGSVMAVELSGHAGWGGTTTMAMSLAGDRKSTRLNSSHLKLSRMPSSA